MSHPLLSVFRSIAAIAMVSLIVTQPIGADGFSSDKDDTTMVGASEQMQKLLGVDFYQVQVLDKNTSVVDAYRSGDRVARLRVGQVLEGFELSLDHKGKIWRAEVGFSFMHDSREGMFITSKFDLMQQAPGREKETFVFLSDWLGNDQLNVTYVLNGTPFRAAIADVTPEVQDSYLETYQTSGVGNLFGNEETSIAIGILSDSNINHFLPLYMRGLGSPRIKEGQRHTTAGAIGNCAAAAACAIEGCDGLLSCASCAVSASSCAWAIGEAIIDGIIGE